MTKKSDNPKRKMITFKMSDQELERLQQLVRGCGSSSRGDIIRRCIRYAGQHPYQVLAAREDEAK
jgi:hypothetical protein